MAHWEARREVLAGKAMIVTMSRRIAVALYDEIVALRPDWDTDDDTTGRIKVVMTGSAADDPTLQPHIRTKEALRALKTRAKDPDDPLETGHRPRHVADRVRLPVDAHHVRGQADARARPLMQAIARVNRTFKDKPAGLVVDYIGIAEDLKTALADYTKRDQDNQELGQDLREQAIPAMLEKHDVVVHDPARFDWRDGSPTGGAKAFLNALTATVEYLLGQHPGTGQNPCTKDNPCLKCRFLAHTRRLVSLFAMCVPVRGGPGDPRRRRVLRGRPRPDRQDRGHRPRRRRPARRARHRDQADRLRGHDRHRRHRHLRRGRPRQARPLPDRRRLRREVQDSRRTRTCRSRCSRRLLTDEIGRIGKTQRRHRQASSPRCSTQSILRYQNRTLDAAQVVAELVALAKDLQAESRPRRRARTHRRRAGLLRRHLHQRVRRLELGDDTLKQIAHELVDIVRRDAKTDWNVSCAPPRILS